MRSETEIRKRVESMKKDIRFNSSVYIDGILDTLEWVLKDD